MRLDPSLTTEQVEPILKQQAEILYGPERAEELADRIAHLARMMVAIASRELPIRGVPPDTSGITDWRGI